MKPGQAVEIQLVDERGKPVRLRNVVPEIRLFTSAGGRRVTTSIDGRRTNLGVL